MSDNKDVTLADIHTALIAILAQLKRMEEKQDDRERIKGEKNPPLMVFDRYTGQARDLVRLTKKHIQALPESQFE